MPNNFSAETSIVISAKPERIWKALTDASQVKLWLFGTQVTCDWEVGSPITYKGEWQGKAYEDKGKILKVIPNKLLVSTYWSGNTGRPDTPENYQQVTYELKPEGEDTRLTLRQEQVPSAAEAEHSKKNWEMVLKGMKDLIEKAG